MEVNLLKENEDGSADYTFTISEKDKNDIVRWALVQALVEMVEKGKLYDPGELNVGDSTSGGEDSVHGSGEQPSEPEQPADGFKATEVSD